MLIKVMRIIRLVPMMVTRVLKIQATMTVATSITSDDVFGVSILDDTHKQSENIENAGKL